MASFFLYPDKIQIMKTNDPNKKQNPAENNDFPGYPHYKSSDDIYSREKEETEIDPENTQQSKSPVETSMGLNEKSFRKDKTGGDLDVPGAELDDAQEELGSEDEENNIYSDGDTE